MSIQKQIDVVTENYVAKILPLLRQQAFEAAQAKIADALKTPLKPSEISEAQILVQLAEPSKAKAKNGKKPNGKKPNGKKTTKEKVGAKRSPETLKRLQAKILASIADNPGENAEVLSKRLKLSSKEIAFPLKKLVATKKVRKTGERRNTKYYLKKTK